MVRWTLPVALVLTVLLPLSVLAEPVTITGTVVDADGEPVEGARVWVMDSSCVQSPTIPVVTNEGGWFSITPTISSQVFSEGELVPPDMAVYAQSPDEQRAAVQVVPPNVTEVTVTLGEAGFLEARVQDQDGGPAAGVEAILMPRPEGKRSYDTPARFASDESGLLRIGPIPAGMDFWIRSGWLAERVLLHKWPEQQMTPLAVGETRELLTMRVNMAGRSIEGIVVDANGDTVAGATVMSSETTTHSVKSSSPPEARTDGEGRFELSGLKSTGLVGVVAIADDATTACGGMLDPELGLHEILQLNPFVVLTGVVTDAEGQPCADVLVGASSTEVSIHHRPEGATPEDIRNQVAKALRVVVKSDENGHWRIERLISGLEYRVWAHERDGGRWGEPIENVVLTGLDANDIAIVIK